MSRHSNENPWRLSPSPPSTSTSFSRAPAQHAPIKGDSWRPKPSSSWTPAQSRPSGSAPRAPREREDERKGAETYRPPRRSPSPARSNYVPPAGKAREWGRGRERSRSRERDRERDNGRGEERSWAAWKDRRENVDRRVDERRRDDDRGWERARNVERRDERRGPDAFRPAQGQVQGQGQNGNARRASPPPARGRRASPDYGVGRRQSPDYGVGRRQSSAEREEKERGRSKSPPRGLPYSPPRRDPSLERKRPPTSPEPIDRAKRPRETSPAPSNASRRRRSPSSASHSPVVTRRHSPIHRSQPLRSPPRDQFHNDHSARPRSPLPTRSPVIPRRDSPIHRSQPLRSPPRDPPPRDLRDLPRRDPSPRARSPPPTRSPVIPRRNSPIHRSQPLRSPRDRSPRRRSPSPTPPRRWGRDRSPSPRRRSRSRTPEMRDKRDSWGSCREGDGLKPVSESYRPAQNGHPRDSSPPKGRRASLNKFFEDPRIPTGPRATSPTKPNGDRRPSGGVEMDRIPSSGSGKSIPLGPRATHGAPPDGREYLDRIAANEREYASHLSSVAPYISAAFQSWVSQNAPPLPEFLRHYFGRAPTMEETDQIERMLEMKMKLGRDERELRGLAEQAKKPSHWSPPPRRRSRSPEKRVNDVPLAHNRYANGHEPTVPPPLTDTPMDTPAGTPKAILPPGEIYERLNCVGEGTYGKVYKARNAVNGQFVALKRIRMEGEKDGFPVTAMREIKLLQGLRHENVIRLIEMMVSKGSVFMVFEYMDYDLTGLLSHPSLSFSPANLKSLNYQMLSGLAYLHHKGILHRDMKGSNILLNAAGMLKLGDFGLARVYAKHRVQDYTNRVITLWYRSPELLLGETAYGPEVDMWSAGCVSSDNADPRCIMLELFVTKPVFQGNDEIHQLEIIYGIMGTPSERDWPGVKELPWYELVKPKEQAPNVFRESFKKWLTPAALDLAEGLLFFDPKRRLSATSALKTAYFTSEEPAMEIPKQLASLGDYHEMDVKAERHRRRKEEGK